MGTRLENQGNLGLDRILSGRERQGQNLLIGGLGKVGGMPEAETTPLTGNKVGRERQRQNPAQV